MQTIQQSGRTIAKPDHFIDRIVWGIFGNADDPQPPHEYMRGWSDWIRHILWWFRNPIHNLTFYVIGCADKDTISTGKDPTTPFVLPRGWNWAVTRTVGGWFPRPFVSHAGRWLRWYAGWRPPGGAFGFKCQRNRD
ncbi:MAG: hypothetical protein FWD62_01750 [Betaproteobacteria bacterium]|nr:hypothetical protein [Betaproteobacteria bacterium]